MRGGERVEGETWRRHWADPSASVSKRESLANGHLGRRVRTRLVPEGHTIHRHARLQGRDLAGCALSVRSPQGWPAAAEAADALDGLRLDRIDAYGKHLLYRFKGPRTLHVHLGLFGRFRAFDGEPPDPRPTTRLRLRSGEHTVDLSGATASGLLDRAGEQKLLARLGPDPLRADADPGRALAALRRRRSTIAAALLDQRVIAGLGNVYRAELLFACGLDPWLAARDCTEAELSLIWATAVAMLTAGERSGRIITVPAAEAGGPPSRLRGRERHQVYRRERCRRCGTSVRSETVAARTLYWCPRCQSPGARPAA